MKEPLSDVAARKKGIVLQMGMNYAVSRLIRKCGAWMGDPWCRPTLLVMAQITLRCNSRCQQCDFWQMHEPEEMTTQEWKRIILDVKKTLGPFYLKFYGGEPCCRQDLVEIVDFCSHHGVATSMVSNGGLLTERLCRDLVKAGIFSVRISLDGASPATHDKFRGVDGMFERAMAAITYLKEYIPLVIHTTITEDNLEEILPLCDIAQRLKIKICFQGLIVVREYRGKFAPPDHHMFVQDRRRLDEVIDELIRRKKETAVVLDSVAFLEHMRDYYHHRVVTKKRDCHKEIRQLVIKRNGNLLPCAFYHPIGNLREQSFAQIWGSRQAREKLKEMPQCDRNSCLVTQGFDPKTHYEKLVGFKHIFFSK